LAAGQQQVEELEAVRPKWLVKRPLDHFDQKRSKGLVKRPFGQRVEELEVVRLDLPHHMWRIYIYIYR
jgi:hypothetical protein